MDFQGGKQEDSPEPDNTRKAKSRQPQPAQWRAYKPSSSTSHAGRALLPPGTPSPHIVGRPGPRRRCFPPPSPRADRCLTGRLVCSSYRATERLHVNTTHLPAFPRQLAGSHVTPPLPRRSSSHPQFPLSFSRCTPGVVGARPPVSASRHQRPDLRYRACCVPPRRACCSCQWISWRRASLLPSASGCAMSRHGGSSRLRRCWGLESSPKIVARS